MREDLLGYIETSAAVKLSLRDKVSEIEGIINALIEVVRKGGTIYSCGNGGSTCDAMHLTEELVSRFKRERPGIRAQHFGDASVLTCWSNDYNFDGVFERQVQTHMTANDALVVFTTSGNSENILRALAAANKIGSLTIALLGKGGGKAKALVKKALVVASNETSHIQEAHIALVHMICDKLEVALFPAPVKGETKEG
jgi:D-sedoheptulose 7-phosphate isomerase